MSIFDMGFTRQHVKQSGIKTENLLLLLFVLLFPPTNFPALNKTPLHYYLLFLFWEKGKGERRGEVGTDGPE